MIKVRFHNKDNTQELNKEEILGQRICDFINSLKKNFPVNLNNKSFLIVNKRLYKEEESLTMKEIIDENKTVDEIIYVETDEKTANLIRSDVSCSGLALDINQKESQITRSISHIRSFVENYTEQLKEELINIIPYDELGSDEEENLAILTKWFKEEFFVFVRGLKCTICNCDSQVVGATYPTPYEMEGLCNNTEVHQCNSCGNRMRFPRYDCVNRLIQTRCGRCAEFANTFTGILIALDFDARIVLDLTDHLWTEVWLESKKRYVHVDPCENIIDAPYVYETGWGKKLNWIFSFGKHDIMDVTKKYTKNYAEVVERRLEVSEEWLEKFILSRREMYRKGLSKIENRELDYKNLMDILSMEVCREENKPEELNDRISGSV